ncbi:BrnT family toxin [Pseudomonas sp. FP2196]|uniref:BrnT family toxin n=1 Tax=Pseudomonas sp. FP2196 TaxID=2954086 RepID=UPI00273740A7|nr:BrnT family toxin [Pseudomonas sp. FP2196]WLH38390.1 BrnT family toxin [Pseudomonas sp. FP2196]
MESFDIQYDKSKNAANKLKHRGASLAETEAVFHDERALTIEDNDREEQRWITLGLDAKGRLLVVAYSYREANVIRIISARVATPSERCEYFLEA